MKNITKQNIKTNPLWIRLLIMTFMLLAGAGNAWAAVTIYFDNSITKWSNVYVYLYSSTYWDTNNGSGSNGIKWCDNGKPMTHIGNNIYSFTYDSSHSGIVAFTKDAQCGYGNFWQTEACYSGTQGLSSGSATNYSTSKPCFTPTTTTITKNQTKYYKGTWTAYTPPVSKAYTATVKFKRPSDWANTPHIHMFYDGSNTLVNDVAMTKEGVDANGNTWFTYTYNVTTTFTTATIMFNNGGWGNGQTAEQFKGDLGKDYCLASASSTTSTKGNVTEDTCPVYCITVNAPVVTADAICAGNTATLTLTNRQDGVTYKLNSTSGTPIFSSTNTYTTSALDANTTYKIYASHADACTNNVEGSVTVTVSPKPAITLKAAPTICNGTTVTFANYVNMHTGTVTWHTKSDFSDAAITSAKPSQTTTYYAKASSGDCTPATASLKVTVNNKPAVPTLSADKTSLIGDEKAIFTVGNTVSGLTYTLYNGETAGESQTSTGSDLTFKAGGEGSYTVRVSNSCGTSASTPAVVITVCTPQTNEFRHANSSYTQLQDQPTYYPGDKAYFVSTINCCLTGTWSANLQKGEEGWWTGLSGSTPNFSMTLTRAGEFTITNMATNGCTQDKNVLVNLDFTVTALSEVTNANGTASGANIALTWNHSATHSKVMVVRYPSSGTETIPAGGQAYTADNTLGGGTVVYVGTAESYTDQNLPAGASYKYYFYTVNNNYYSEGVVLNMSSCPTPAKPSLSSTAITACNGECTAQGYITITNMNDYKDDTYTFELGSSVVDPDANGRLGINSTAYTQYTVTVTNSCGNSNSATVDIAINDNKPTISGATYTQPGKANAITLTAANGILADWSVNNGGDLSQTSKSNTTDFSADANGTYTITADNGGCTATHVVTVSDAFYIWVRNAKENETAYGQFYYPNENSPEYRGGEMFYAECDALPTQSNYSNYNRGGREADLVQNDCDGYTWYGFRASADVISGEKYFYVHAKNDISYGGYFTHTVPTKVNLTGDVYYTLGTTGNSYNGWNIVSASAPYEGPRVHASGATALGTNKFAALYVTDCSGKEIDAYQWESCSTQAGAYANYQASVTNSGTLYSGDAGKTNNIRPSELGYYRCKVTYKDGSTVTSEPVQVTGSYTHASSTLPVIIVNTNGVGFPVNNTCQTPSAHADDMKEKVSVDVKIYDGSTMVYDRKARMNYRGSSSLNFLKKSYAFCPGKDNCVEDKGRLDYVKTEKMNMLGIGEASDKDWVLYAAAADPSLMRNRLMFDTFRDMTGGWSVNSRYVELYVDGVYKGVYVMMDKITQNKKRVNITASNGFIVKFDKTDLVDRYEVDGDKKTFKSLYSGYDGESGNGMKTYDTYIDQRFEIEYPEMEDVEEDSPGMWSKTVSDIKTLFNNFESNLKAGNYAEVQKIIDYTSWADWFIISEYAKNMDAYRASCLFVYNGGKIEARPLWDQELSFNNQCANLCATYGCNSTTGLLIENSEIYEEGCSAPFWFTGKYVGGRGTEAKSGAQFEGYLLNDPCFIAVLKERWALHTATGGALTQDVMNAKISGYEKDLGSVGTSGTPLYRERNTFWSGKSRKTIDKANSGGTCFTGETGYQDTEISTSISAMKSWITGNRRTNLGTLITNMEGSPLSISFMPQEVTTTPWEPITLQVINKSSYDYTITYTDGELDKQSGVIINKTDDTFKINVPRPSTWPAGDEEVEDERADITYGIKATLNVADGTTVCGKSEVTPATATIILKDEPNENCPQP